MNWVEAQAHKPIPAPFFLPANLFNKKLSVIVVSFDC